MAKPKVVAWSTQYGGYKITLNTDGAFVIKGIPQESFDSLKHAKEHLDEKVKAKEAESRKRVSLAAIGTDGKSYVVTGVNARTAAILTTPKSSSYSGPDLYFESGTSKKLLEARKAAQDRAMCILVLLKPFKVEDVRNRYGGFDHATEVDRLQAAYDKAMKITHPDLEGAIKKTKPGSKFSL